LTGRDERTHREEATSASSELSAETGSEPGLDAQRGGAVGGQVDATRPRCDVRLSASPVSISDLPGQSPLAIKLGEPPSRSLKIQGL
jgi:hypothetical protein